MLIYDLVARGSALQLQQLHETFAMNERAPFLRQAGPPGTSRYCIVELA